MVNGVLALFHQEDCLISKIENSTLTLSNFDIDLEADLTLKPVSIEYKQKC